MERLLYKDLLEWKDSPDRMPLILDGVRQCGKTYLLKKFGEENFRSMVYCNFEEKDYARLFERDLDPHRIIGELSLITSTKVYPGETLIVFDEVQECKPALTSLKYFQEAAPEYHVVCAGSLLGILTSQPGSFPVGKVDRMRLYPMNFHEFLLASGGKDMLDRLKGMDLGERMIPQMHDRLCDLLREYHVIGGMPAAVRSWVRSRSVRSVGYIQKRILDGYREDFSKHGGDLLPMLLCIWDGLSRHFGNSAGRVMFNTFGKKTTSGDVEQAMEWMERAGLIHRVHQVRSVQHPLALSAEDNMYKVYFMDVGLMRRFSGMRPSFVHSTSEKDRIFKGNQSENLAVCELLSNSRDGIGLYYWKDGRFEVDLLADTARGVIPIEVKSETNTSDNRSLDAYIRENSPEMAVVTSTDEPGRGRVIKVPLHTIGLLPSRLEEDEEKPPVSVPTVFHKRFSESSWRSGDGAWTLTVPASEHGTGTPMMVQVYRRRGRSRGLVVLDTEIFDDGDVVLRSDEPFEGDVSMVR